MSNQERWLLPEGIEELLPGEAVRVEHLRRSVLDLFSTWGYEYVIPPLIEYMDSLVVGAGNDLKRYTFKLIDERNGRLLGVRADMTPQVARIDAHRLQRKGSARLCYFGPVLLTQPRQIGGSRSPIQVGAELYGDSGLQSDVEIMRLMLQVLKKVGVDGIHLDLGHVGVFRGLIEQAGLDADQESTLFDALQRKAKPELKQLTASLPNPAVGEMLLALADLNGDSRILEVASKTLSHANEQVKAALKDLSDLVAGIQNHNPELVVHVDLAELRGYEYHTGVVFSAYSLEHWQALAQGGRYDAVGAAFGRTREATGFSMDINNILRVTHRPAKPRSGIWAPATDDVGLHDKIASLRAEGQRVIEELPGVPDTPQDLGCDRQLVRQGKEWQVEKLESN